VSKASYSVRKCCKYKRFSLSPNTHYSYHNDPNQLKLAIHNVLRNSNSINLVLFEPEIPPNTGNLIRLCANTGIGLHLVEPLGFSLETKALRRAGLDYHETAQVKVHSNLDACFDSLGVLEGCGDSRVFAVTTKGSVIYDQPIYQPGDILLFGPETRGLPDGVLADGRVFQKIRVPMMPDSRSLNLSNAAAIISYEALRQLNFPGLR
jgi:tRNA (cytidine/uridine-2'-O-)-methyltransferase